MHHLINCETWTKIEIEGKQRPLKQGTVKWKWCHTEPSVRHSCCSWTEFKESVSSCHFMATRLHIQTQLHVDTLIQALNSCSGKKIATGTGWVTLGIKARVKTKQLPPASIFPLFPPLSVPTRHTSSWKRIPCCSLAGSTVCIHLCLVTLATTFMTTYSRQ